MQPMWAIFCGDKRVSRLFPNERACIRAAKDDGYFIGPVLIEDYRILPVT